MIIITRHDVTDEELDHIRERVEAFGLETHLSRGKHRTVVGCIGDEELLAGVPLRSIPGVEAVHSVMKPYKLANLQFAAEPTKVPLGGTAVGDTSVAVIAGPCSVEGLEMLSETGQRVRKAGAVGLRGGAFKPRSSPYSFGGLGVCAAEAQAAGQDGSGVCGDVADWGHDGLGRGVADESGWLGGRREGRAGVPRSFHRRDGVGHGALRRPGGCAAA